LNVIAIGVPAGTYKPKTKCRRKKFTGSDGDTFHLLPQKIIKRTINNMINKSISYIE
jgi:hypothetical protein